MLVELGAAELADLLDRAGVTEAVGHALGNPSLDAQSLGEVASVELSRERLGEHAAQVGGSAELMDFMDLHEVLVFDEVIVVAPSAAAAVAGIAVLFDFDQRDFQCESAMRVDASEMDELVKNIEERAFFRAASARDDAAAGTAELYEMFADDDWFH